MMPCLTKNMPLIVVSLIIAGCGGNSATPQVNNPQAQNLGVDEQPDGDDQPDNDTGTTGGGTMGTIDSTQELTDLQGLWSSGCVLDDPEGHSLDGVVLTLSLNGNDYWHTTQYFTDNNCVDPKSLDSEVHYSACEQVTTGPLLPQLTGNTIVESGFLYDTGSDLIPTPLGGATDIRVFPDSVLTGAGESLDAYDCGDIEPVYGSMYIVSGDLLYFELLDNYTVSTPDDDEFGVQDSESDTLNNADRPRVLDFDYPYTRVQ